MKTRNSLIRITYNSSWILNFRSIWLRIRLEGCEFVSRSYVAIEKKELNYFLYFDFKDHEIFAIAERKNQSTGIFNKLRFKA